MFPPMDGVFFKLKNTIWDHKTSQKGHLFKYEMYASSECWINHISIDVWFG